MMTLEQVINMMKDRNLSEVSRRTGIARQTISNIVNGYSTPSYETVKKLSDYLEGKV